MKYHSVSNSHDQLDIYAINSPVHQRLELLENKLFKN